ncbi:c-type cytochrome [Chthonobacter albigriseus]|uniref:c-type cytochrome n=1 Tax=Chthonobacter albigriseus TaxID=1683161 RepID=UPI0015EE6904|nr:c-type cytochrome [Chthonobacter albigriseus]
MRIDVVVLAAVLAAMALPSRAAESVDLAGLVAACAPCHGPEGLAPDTLVPHLAGQNYGYLLSQLRAFHSGQRAHEEMRFMTRRMTEAEMEALADYYASLPR